MRKDLDFAWAAGLWEGEGYACITPGHGKRRGKGDLKPMIGMSCSDRTLLERIAKLFGSGVYLKRKAGYVSPRGIKLNHDHFQWVISYRKALVAAKAMLPHVKGEKRQRLQDIIDYYEEKDGANHVN